MNNHALVLNRPSHDLVHSDVDCPERAGIYNHIQFSLLLRLPRDGQGSRGEGVSCRGRARFFVSSRSDTTSSSTLAMSCFVFGLYQMTGKVTKTKHRWHKIVGGMELETSGLTVQVRKELGQS